MGTSNLYILLISNLLGEQQLADVSSADLLANWCLCLFYLCVAVAFKIYDIDRDGYISNGELFQVLKMMVGNNLKDGQLQQIVDKTIIYSDKDGDGRISYDEFCAVSATTPYISC